MLYCFSLVEKYRSGHNEPHSKCGVPYGTVGSNPTFSANIEKDNFFKKGIVLFLLSKNFLGSVWGKRTDILHLKTLNPHEKKLLLPYKIKGNIIDVDALFLTVCQTHGEIGEKMDKKCSLCGNIYKNRVFKGGYICADCRTLIKEIDVQVLTLNESKRPYKNKRTP